MLPQKITSHYHTDFSGAEPFTCLETRRDASGRAVSSNAIHHVDGMLSVRVTWDTSKAAPPGTQIGKSSSPEPSDPTAGMISALTGLTPGDTDPNNPADLQTPVLNGAANADKSPEELGMKPKYFRLDTDDDDLCVLQSDKYEQRRNQLLSLRETGKIDSLLQTIPFKGEDVTPEMLESAGDDEDILNFRKSKKKKVLTAGEQKLRELKQRAGGALPSY